MGIDEAFGSSRFAIVITQGRENMIEVIYSEEFDKPLHNDMIDLIVKLKNKHHIIRLFVDASNAGFVKGLKQRIGDSDYNYYAESKRIVNALTDALVRYNAAHVTPINFSTCHRPLLLWLKLIPTVVN